jgi:hypothetical protein
MEHDASKHWHQANTIRQAASELDRIDQYESALVDYEQFVANQTDTLERIRSLLDLSTFYHREFGVHFEKRHAYRDQLHRVLVGDLPAIEDARIEARNQYAMTDGLGLPRLERLARFGIAA